MVPELVGKLTGLGLRRGRRAGCRHARADRRRGVRRGRRDRRRGRARGRRPGRLGAAARQPTRSSPAAARAPRRSRSCRPTRSPRLVADLRDCGRHARSRWSWCRGSPAPSRWTRCRRRRWSSGYRCAIVAAGMLRRFFPLNMTAAGTVQPARSWCSAPASPASRRSRPPSGSAPSSRRTTSARPPPRRSARWARKSIDLELETLEGAGGYAREMTEERAARQRELLAPYIAAADALITTAAVPGRQAPLLVTARDGRADEARLGRGRPGRRDRRQRRGRGRRARSSGSATPRSGAARNVPSQMPGPASRLYAQNIVNIVTLMTRRGERRRGRLVRPRLRGRDRRSAPA